MMDLIFLIFIITLYLFWPTRSYELVEPPIDGDKGQSPKSPNPFNNLPEELVVEIGNFLSPVDRACLAYTNRWAHDCMGRALRFACPKTKGQFLDRLDREGYLPLDILCSKCLKFHPPRTTREWSDDEGRRACIRDPDSDDSPYLPRHIFFDLVAAVCRSFRLKSGSYIVNCLTDRREFTTEGAKIKSKTWAKICKQYSFDNDQVILKTENVLFLERGPDLVRNVASLHELLAENWDLTMVCQHISWDMIWPFILNPEALDVKSYDHVLGTDPALHAVAVEDRDLSSCIWTHGMSCWTRCDAGPWIEWHLDELWSCTRCSTDYKISVMRKPSGYARTNAVVFTSWKNLGTGMSWSEPEWREHLADDGDDRDLDRRSTPRGSAAEMFEGRENLLGYQALYMPEPRDVWGSW